MKLIPASCAGLLHRRHLFRREDKQCGDEDGFRDCAIFLERRDLEGFARFGGEDVEVQAVVPVGATDERQAVRAEVVQRVVQRPLQVLGERRLGAGFVLVSHRRVEDVPVAGFLEVGHDRQRQPERIVVEAAADRVVAALGEGLELVIRAAALQLRRRQVEDALTGALRRPGARSRASPGWNRGIPIRARRRTRRTRPSATC